MDMADLEFQLYLINGEAIILCHYFAAVSYHAVAAGLNSDLCAIMYLWSQMFALIANCLTLMDLENRQVRFDSLICLLFSHANEISWLT